jgi:hypothetical protein
LFGTSGDLGAGQANTTAIVNGCAEGGIAARICDDLVLNGYSDWFLPSTGEMTHMDRYKNEIGGFATATPYWSSTENTGYNAWALWFNRDQSEYEFKYHEFCVRAIRAF